MIVGIESGWGVWAGKGGGLIVVEGKSLMSRSRVLLVWRGAGARLRSPCCGRRAWCSSLQCQGSADGHTPCLLCWLEGGWKTTEDRVMAAHGCMQSDAVQGSCNSAAASLDGTRLCDMW